MFWIGFIIGAIVATIAIVGYIAYCCAVTYGDMDTFMSMSYAIQSAANNRRSDVFVMHDGEVINKTVFE